MSGPPCLMSTVRIRVLTGVTVVLCFKRLVCLARRLLWLRNAVNRERKAAWGLIYSLPTQPPSQRPVAAAHLSNLRKLPYPGPSARSSPHLTLSRTRCFWLTRNKPRRIRHRGRISGLTRRPALSEHDGRRGRSTFPC